MPPTVAAGTSAEVIDLAGASATVRERRDSFPARLRIGFGAVSDHALVTQLLTQSGHNDAADRFANRIDEPAYRPADRILVRSAKGLAGQVLLSRHVGWFEGQRTAVVRLEDLCVLPEYRGSGLVNELLAAAEDAAAREGVVLALLRTHDPAACARRDWAVLRGQGHTRADAMKVLAHLDAQESTRKRLKSSGLMVRSWRHVELDELVSIYEQSAPGMWGAANRTDEYWRWLLAGSARDHLLTAVQPRRSGADAPIKVSASDNCEFSERVVGYAVVRGACIMEMMTLPTFSRARAMLLAHACREAIDRGHHWIALYTPATEPLHDFLVTAGGSWIGDAAPSEPKWMLKLLAPEKWVERMYPVWQKRAREADIPRPLRITFACDDSVQQFTLTRRSSRLEPAADGEPTAGVVVCSTAMRNSLLLGNAAIRSAVDRGHLKIDRPELLTTLTALFSPRLFWQSPLDLLPG